MSQLEIDEDKTRRQVAINGPSVYLDLLFSKESRHRVLPHDVASGNDERLPWVIIKRHVALSRHMFP